jgi:hypothetical protein
LSGYPGTQNFLMNKLEVEHLVRQSLKVNLLCVSAEIKVISKDKQNAVFTAYLRMLKLNSNDYRSIFVYIFFAQALGQIWPFLLSGLSTFLAESVNNVCIGQRGEAQCATMRNMYLQNTKIKLNAKKLVLCKNIDC